MVKQPGLCSLCAAECFEIVSKYDDGFEFLKGRIRKVGKPLDTGWKITLLLSNDAHMDLTVCEACLPSCSSKLPELWQNVIESYEFELKDEFRRCLGGQPYSEEKKQTEMTFITSMMPLMIIEQKRWIDG